MAIKETNEPTYVVCPECGKLVDTMLVRAIVCQYIGVILGYDIECDRCGNVSFMNFGAHPPLLSIVSTKPSVWTMPEV